MKIVDTFQADIYLSATTPEGYHYDAVAQVLENWVATGGCVSICDCDYVHTDAYEMGYKLTLINYPRFPSTPEELTERALELAKILKNACNQNRVSVVTTDKTYMLEEDE